MHEQHIKDSPVTLTSAVAPDPRSLMHSYSLICCRNPSAESSMAAVIVSRTCPNCAKNTHRQFLLVVLTPCSTLLIAGTRGATVLLLLLWGYSFLDKTEEVVVSSLHLHRERERERGMADREQTKLRSPPSPLCPRQQGELCSSGGAPPA